MKVFSYSEARQHLAEVLNRAGREGKALIRRRNGQVFVISPDVAPVSPLDVPGVASGLSRKDIVDLVRDSRRSTARLLRSDARPTRRTKRPD